MVDRCMRLAGTSAYELLRMTKTMKLAGTNADLMLGEETIKILT